MIKGTTGCGLQYAVRRSGNAVGYCALSIRCGTRDEEGFHSGIAHFTEHTIFKGTEHKSATVINSYLDRLGGELNAYTTKEEIVLHATVLKEDLPKAAKLLFELVTSPTFPENAIETERGVVIDEINSYKDLPSEEIYDRFEEMLFEGHPLSKPILGTAGSVRKITRNELLRFVKEKFIPSNMAFTVVADIEETKLEKAINRLADTFLGNSETTVHGPGNNAVHHTGRNIFDKTVNKKNHQVNCVIGNTAPSLYQERERIATALLCNILGGPASNSVFNAILREKNGWVYGVECSYTQYSDTGIVAICLGCDKDNIEKCIASIDRELKKFQAEPMSDKRLDAAKKQFLGQLAISSDNGESQCLSMGKSLLAYNTVTSDIEIRNKIEAVTAEELRRLACEIFDKDRTSRLIFI